ncbi:hypothetical protein, partial [Bacillus inaquosorum]|uniref:hypothetical protein n=1 Tax=Bacillus inaquosorum TaxID=483913 RepID=UPI0022A2FF7C|nr:hypothetical protein [Bacillus inaquosorum]
KTSCSEYAAARGRQPFTDHTFSFDVTGSFTLSFLVAGFVLLLGLIFYVFVLGDVKRIKLE